MTTLYTRAQLAKHNTEDDCWCSLEDKRVYNLTEYIKYHPGGKSVILEWAGKDITEIMKDMNSHEHSEHAYEQMEDFLIGYLVSKEEEERLSQTIPQAEEAKGSNEYDSTVFTNVMPSLEQQNAKTDFARDYQKHHFLDLSKPLLPQMLKSNFTREFYIDQVHRPRHCGSQSANLFGVWFLEPFSKTPWWLIPTIWIPVVLFLLNRGFHMVSLPTFIICFFLGLVNWTLFEYGIHRFVFHLDDHVPRMKIFFILHFLMHGVHHYLPMDPLRLVMPPALFCFLATPIIYVYFCIFPQGIAYSLIGANILGYVYYDLCHYALHHAELPGVYNKLKKHHIAHHYKNYQLGFGITNRFWDWVFSTSLDDKAPVAISKVKKT